MSYKVYILTSFIKCTYSTA